MKNERQNEIQGKKIEWIKTEERKKKNLQFNRKSRFEILKNPWLKNKTDIK